MDSQIIENIKDKMKDITTPVCAFVTFTTQEAFERCSKYLFKYDDIGNINEH